MENQIINLNDINTEYLDSPEKAKEIQEQCIALMSSSHKNFSSVAEQNCARRVLSQISGGNIKSLANGCKTMAEAQQLLVNILKTQAMHTGKQSYLMAQIANTMSKDAKRLNKTAETLNSHHKAILNLQTFLQRSIQENQKLKKVLINQQKRLTELEGKQNDDPSDERYWNQELRLYLFAIILFSAMADGKMTNEEISLIKKKKDILALKGKYKEVAEWLLENRNILRSQQNHYLIQTSQIPSYQVRLNIFQHAIAVAFSDRHYSFRERFYVRKLSGALKISKGDCDMILNSAKINKTLASKI
ncbi:MAG: tellurite resistance TerB family protein [Sedimentisphaerales bacterium]